MVSKKTTLALFLLALLPRALAGRFLTVDEAYHWIERVERFLEALRAGDFAATNLIGHPGVTTLWLGASGALVHEWAVALGLLAPENGDARRALLRLPVALATALCVALAYPMLRRLLGGRMALLATLLIAGEPFLVAHSQLLHLDALLASFMTLSLLAALCAVSRPALRSEGETAGRATLPAPHPPGAPPPAAAGTSWRWWLLSGVAGGLALLTKSPAITLVPMIGLIAVAEALQPAAGDSGRPSAFSLQRLAFGVQRSALWCLVAAAVWLALWPAAWVDPLGAMARVARQASADGGAPHGWGNFFLGRAVADPGPLFYPLTIAFRLAPWTLAGLILYFGFWIVDCGAWLNRGGSGAEGPRGSVSVGSPGIPTPLHRTLLLLVFFALAFTVGMSLLPKKFDRYVLPVFPALDVLAAAGILRVARSALHIVRWRVQRDVTANRQRATSNVQRAGWALAILVLGVNLALHHPYHLAYFNPLLGGGPAAARLVPVGWGEGYELAGDFIAAQPDGADQPTAARYEPVLAPFVPAGAAPLAWWQIPGRVDYAVLYIDQLQRDDKPETFRPLLESGRPVHTVRINGIEYAYVYRIPPPVAVPLPADFGDALHLRGYGLDASAARASGALTLTLEWEARAAPGRDLALFAHVFNAAGERVTQVDVAPGGERAPTSVWQPGSYYSLVQRVPLPADLPAGVYHIAVGVYDPATFVRLPLRAPPRPPLPEAGADALILGPFRLP